MNRKLKQLLRLINKWGGHYRQIKNPELAFKKYLNKKYSTAPFVNYFLCTDWNKKEIIFDYKQINISHLIHEMGHVFACEDPPEYADEYPFFGWEYLLAQKLNIVNNWIQANQNYTINRHNDEFGTISKQKQIEVISESIELAKHIGIVDKNDQPIAIR